MSIVMVLSFPTIRVEALELDVDAEAMLRAILNGFVSAFGGRYEVVIVLQCDDPLSPQERYADPELVERKGELTIYRINKVAKKRGASFIVECDTKRSSAYALLYLSR